MKIVIDIPDEDYKFIKDLQFYNSGRRSGRTIERNVINAIKNGKPYEEKPQGEWISVSERLPEQANQAYLVTLDYGDDVVCSCQRFFFGKGIGWNDDCVVAWMPLPEPYKEEEEDG